MPVAKLKAANSADAMKSEEPNDSLDTFIRQAIGKESFLSFSRSGDSPVQWIQLLHALDQQDIPGRPLLTPLKVQMQKCDKCSREFCSPINYRRHIRVYHRLKKLDKDSAKNRDLLAAFWDKLSDDEAKEVISFKDVSLEEVLGSSVIKSLTTLVKGPGFSALPQVCLRAGSALLDLVQARPSRFPISSQELFSILDHASERTFLCGAAVSMQKYIFDGEAGKIGLETKNLVACTSFLVEQKLVKAWLADKDAEALRCQKLLVEEEEAAQKRQVELLERKRQKKFRQKAKEQRHWNMEEGEQNMDDLLEFNTPGETSSALAAFDSDGQNPVISTDEVLRSAEPIHFSNLEEDVDYEIQMGFSNGYCDPGTSQNVERQMEKVGGRQRIVVSRLQTPAKSHRGVLNGFHASQNSHGFKFGDLHKHGTNRERVAAIGNSNKMWSRKPKEVYDGESLKIRAEKQAANQLDQNENHEVLIGSISVSLGNCSYHEGNNLAEALDRCLAECQMPKKNNVQEKFSKLDPVQGVTNRSTIKFWRPVSRHESKSSLPLQNGVREFEVEVIAEKDGVQTPNESCLRSYATDGSDGVVSMNLSSTIEESVQPGSLQFDSHAKAFLAQRWKEAIAGEHVTLVLSPNLEPPGCSEVETDSSEKWMVKTVAFEASTGGAAKGKFRTKPEKGTKIKYFPKQRSAT